MADINLGVGGANSATGGYEIDNSLKFEADNSEYMTYTPSSTTNNKVWTFSAWIKRTELGVTNHTVFGHYTDGDNHTIIRFDGGDKLDVRNTVSTTAYQLDTDMLFRDTSAWYHIVVAFDTTQATAANRTKVYINGSQVDLSGTYTGQNVVTYFNTASKGVSIGAPFGAAEYNSGYMAEINFVDGSQLDATSFGEYDDDSGIWIPKEYTGSHGTNGFYLDFEDSSSLGADDSGNGNNFTLDNIAAADQATDTPTNNFTIFNCVRRFNSDNLTVTDGGTVLLKNATSTWTTGFNTIAVNKGKWYWEGELYANEGYQMFGQTPQHYTERNVNIDWYLGKNADKSAGAGYYGSGEDVYYEGGYAHSSASTAGDIISVAMDCDNNKVHFAVNGVYTNSSDPANNTNGFAMTDEYQYFAMATFLANTSYRANFGGYTTISISSAASDANGYGTFEYAPPSGYYALCTKNLAEYG